MYCAAPISTICTPGAADACRSAAPGSCRAPCRAAHCSDRPRARRAGSGCSGASARAPAPKPTSATALSGTVAPEAVRTGRFSMVARLRARRLDQADANRNLPVRQRELGVVLRQIARASPARTVSLMLATVTPSCAALSRCGRTTSSGRAMSPLMRGSRSSLSVRICSIASRAPCARPARDCCRPRTASNRVRRRRTGSGRSGAHRESRAVP